MATREDFTVDYLDNPRIIEIASPSTEVTMQDLVDTLRIEEEKFSGGSTFKHLINASGKESLGGGVSVGITTALQNALVAFEARTTPAETGTVTTGSSAPVAGKITFADTAADFVTAGVKRGSLVINFTDQSVADVVSVDNATTLTTKTLVNGIGNTYDINDVYHVFNIIQVNATGGNITAVDDMAGELDPLLPTAFTQVVRTSSSSATISSIEENTYFSVGGIHVDTTTSFSGTDFPNGTPAQRVNNLSDARIIADKFGITQFVLHSDVTLDQEYTQYQFDAAVFFPVVNLNSQDTMDGLIKGCEVTGTQVSRTTYKQCRLNNITDFEGFADRCEFIGTTILAEFGDGVSHDCFSHTTGGNIPVIDFNAGKETHISFNGHTGALILRNMDVASSPDSILNIKSGQVTLEPTCTQANIVIRGVLNIVDNSNGTNVDTLAVVEGWRTKLSQEILHNSYTLSDTNGLMTITLDDGTTITTTAYKDTAKTIPWDGNGSILGRDVFI